MKSWQHKVMTNLAALFTSESAVQTKFVMGEYCLIITPLGEIKFRHYPQTKVKVNIEQDVLEKSLCGLLDNDILMVIQDMVTKEYEEYNAPEMIRGYIEDSNVNRAIANYVKSKCFKCEKNLCSQTL